MELAKLYAVELNIRVGQSVVKPVTTVWNLGVLINAELSMHDHVSRLAQTYFFHLRRLCSVRHIGQEVTEQLVCAFVLSRLDYCNTVLAGLPASTLAPFATLGTLNSEVGYELVLVRDEFGYELAAGMSWSGYRYEDFSLLGIFAPQSESSPELSLLG